MKYEITKKINGPLYITEEDLIKQNANCPASEKTGSGPGSCGGSNGKDSKNDFSDVTDKRLRSKLEAGAETRKKLSQQEDHIKSLGGKIVEGDLRTQTGLNRGLTFKSTNNKTGKKDSYKWKGEIIPVEKEEEFNKKNPEDKIFESKSWFPGFSRVYRKQK